VVREDANIDFTWGGGSPAPSVPADRWSARWTKDQFFAGGNYRFTTEVDEGVRLYVDGKLRISQWDNTNTASFSADVNLSWGTHLIRMEYRDTVGDAIAKLSFDPSPLQSSPAPESKPSGTTQAHRTKRFPRH
jgi:hypothetical protein